MLTRPALSQHDNNLADVRYPFAPLPLLPNHEDNMADNKPTQAAPQDLEGLSNAELKQMLQALIGTVGAMQKSVASVQELAQAVREGQPTKKTPWSRHNPRTPFAEGKKKTERSKLKRTFFQNGYRVPAKLLFDREIDLINQLKPGRYVNNMVNVKIIESHNSDPDQVQLHYPNKTVDQRLALSQEVRGLYGMLQRCIAEAEQNEVIQDEKRRG